MATGTGGGSQGSSRFYSSSGTGYSGLGSGMTTASGVFPPQGTGLGSAGRGATGGISPPSGTGLGGTSSRDTRGVFPPSGLPASGAGQISGGPTGVRDGIFAPMGLNAKLTGSGGVNASIPTRAASCGLCDVIIPQVQVQYFVQAGVNPNASCTQGAGGGPTITPPPAPALVKRRLGRRNGTFEEGIVVSDDYTFTSPSMYVVMSQGIQVTDRCGTLGSSLASAVVPVSDLSTVSYNIPSGAILTDAVNKAQAFTKPLRAEDLACPTWGISGNWNPRPNADPLEIPGGIDLDVPAPAEPGATTLAIIGVVQDDTHVGAPWYPIIMLPHEVLNLQPLWRSCEGRLINPSFPIFDPPHPLQAETVLVSSTAPAAVQAEVTGEPTPTDEAGEPIAPLPSNQDSFLVNVNPNKGKSGDALVKIPQANLVEGSALALAPPAASPQVQEVANSAAPANDPSNVVAAVPATPLADTQGSTGTEAAPVVAPAANPAPPAPAAQNAAFIQSLSAALAVSTVNVVPVPAANSPGTNAPAANAPVANAAVQANVVNSPAENQSPANPPAAVAPTPLSVGGQPVQQQGSTLVVGGQSIAPGSSGSVAGHQVVNNGNNVVVDGSSQAIQPNPTPAPAPLPSVGGEPIQQQGNNLVVAGQSIAPGSTANVAGHQVVNNGNNVVVDGSSQAVPQATPAAVYVGGSSSGGVVAGGVAPAFAAVLPASLPSVGGQPVQQQGSNLVVAGQTIAPGASANVAGHQVANNGNALVVDGSTQALPLAGTAPTPPGAPAVTVGGTPYTADSSGNFVISGQTLNGKSPITVAGTPISILPGSSAVAIGSSTQALVTPPPNANNANSPAQPPLTIDGSTYYPTGPSSAYVLPGGQTLTPGAQITVGGTPVSLAPDGSNAVVGGSTENLAPTITPPPGQPALTIGGTTYHPTGASSAYVIGGQTLTPGSGPITVSGTPISLAANGASAVVGSSTENLQPPITSPAGLIFGGTTYRPTSVPGASSAYIINGQTITPGAAPVTISGTPVSVAANGASAVVGGLTEDLGASASSEPAITFDGSTYHPITGAPSDYVVGSQTLTPGGVITVSGTPISLATNGASAVIGSSTQNLQMTKPPLTFGGSTYYPVGPSSDYVIDGQTITPGASTTISGTPISLASDGATAVVGTSTEDLLPSLTSGAVLTIGGQSFTPNPTSFVVAGKTMTVGGSAIISGTPMVLEPGGTLMVGTSEIPLATASGKLTGPTGTASNPLTGSAASGKKGMIPWIEMVSLGLVGIWTSVYILT